MYVYIIVHVYFDENGYTHEKVNSIYADLNEARERANELNSMCFPWDTEWYEIDEMWVHCKA